MNLYALTAEYQTALIKLNDSDLPQEVIDDTLEGLQGAIEVKGANVAAFALNLEAEIEAIKVVEGRIADRRKALEKRHSSLERYLLENMQRCGIGEIKALDGTFKVSLRNNPAKVVVDAECLIPDEYVRVIPEQRAADKAVIKEAIKAGVEVPGAHLEQAVRVEIK